ncbi:MAG: EpsG family protein [Muribaculaceae bacterium]|nr:EpsG family protein [Muribaculaceae bacterium]MDE6346625.1 EpsG family protein [Muribaculaceae bacterium]
MILCKEIVLESVSTFWGLRLFLVAVIVFCSWGITYKNRDNNYYWYYALPIIVFYTLIQGLRFDRGVDYPQYADELEYDIYAGNNITREFLYDVFVMFFRNFKIPFYFGFMIYSGLLISGFMLLVKKFREYAFWIVPIFYLLTLDASENFIRQFIALSFVYYAYYYYLQRSIKKMYAMLIIIPFIHLSGLFVVGAFLVCAYVNFTKLLKSALPLLGFYLALTAVWDITNLDSFADSLQTVDSFQDTNFEGYVDNSEKWFTEEGDLDKARGIENSLVREITDFLCNCAIVWFGFAVCRRDRRFNIAYYGSYLAIIISVIGGSVELIGRMAWWLLPLEPIIIGGMLTPEKKYKLTDWVLIGLFFVAYYVKFFLQVGKPGLFGSAFVWDIV